MNNDDQEQSRLAQQEQYKAELTASLILHAQAVSAYYKALLDTGIPLSLAADLTDRLNAELVERFGLPV